MFERFARAARAAVVDAHARAQAEQAPTLTDDHLLAALLAGPQSAHLLPAVHLTPDEAAQVLASALKRARALGDRELPAEYLLLAFVGRRDPGAEALAARGVTPVTVLDALERARRGAA